MMINAHAAVEAAATATATATVARRCDRQTDAVARRVVSVAGGTSTSTAGTHF